MRVPERRRRAGAGRREPKGQLVDQQVADITLRDVAAKLGKIEPASRIQRGRIALGNGLDVIVFSAPSSRALVPFVCDDKAVQARGPPDRDELAQGSRLVNAYLDVAESMALREIPMTMQAAPKEKKP